MDIWSATFWATSYGAAEAQGEGGGAPLASEERGEVALEPATKAWGSNNNESHCLGAVAGAIPLTSWYKSCDSSSTSWDVI